MVIACCEFFGRRSTGPSVLRVNRVPVPLETFLRGEELLEVGRAALRATPTAGGRVVLWKGYKTWQNWRSVRAGHSWTLDAFASDEME